MFFGESITMDYISYIGLNGERQTIYFFGLILDKFNKGMTCPYFIARVKDRQGKFQQNIVIDAKGTEIYIDDMCYYVNTPEDITTINLIMYNKELERAIDKL